MDDAFPEIHGLHDGAVVRDKQTGQVYVLRKQRDPSGHYKTARQALIDSGTSPDGVLHPVADEALQALDELVLDLEERADYLQSEINKMRRVMQAAGTWDRFCRDFADAEAVPRPWGRRIDLANPCTCDHGFDRDCPRHGDVSL